MKVSDTANLKFLETSDYPAQVKEHFHRILSYIDESKADSVILTGSTSRGELSYRLINGNLSIYSDYEFLIIAKGKIDPADVQRLLDIYRKLESEFSNVPLFHIDFAYIDKKRFFHLPFHLKYYEMRESGKTIFGRDLLKHIRQIDTDNLDFKDLNEILIWRLWQILLYMPSALVQKQRPSHEQEDLYCYVLCRNFLDLATWRLPFRGILLSGFRKRYNYLRNHFEEWKDDAVIDEGFIDLLQESMTGKFELHFGRSSDDLFRDTLYYFIKAKNFLIGDPRQESESQIRKPTSNLFHDYHYKHKMREVLFLFKHFKQMGLFGGFGWLLTKKHELMLEFLCTIHQAVISNLKGEDKQGFQQLKQAELILDKLTPARRAASQTGFMELWRTLRTEFAGFLIHYFPSIRMKADYIYSLLRHSDEQA